VTRTVDFDAFRAEQKLEAFNLVIGGKTYEMPPSLPAALALDVIRLSEEMDAKAEPKIDDLMRIGAALFGGKEQFRTVLLEAGVGLDELGDLIQMVIEAYTGKRDPNPEAQA
jgi:hypothetical protein